MAVCFGERCEPRPGCRRAGRVAGNGEGCAAPRCRDGLESEPCPAPCAGAGCGGEVPTDCLALILSSVPRGTDFPTVASFGELRASTAT